jgi:hypothetical protein
MMITLSKSVEIRSKKGASCRRLEKGRFVKNWDEFQATGLDVKKNNRDSLDLRPAVLNQPSATRPIFGTNLHFNSSKYQQRIHGEIWG